MTRGDGRIFCRGKTVWIAYYHHGVEIRESAKTDDEKKARKLLKQRLIERQRPNFVGPKEERWTLEDMEQRIRADYVKRDNRSWKTVMYCFKHLKRIFPYHRVVDITAAEVEKYQAQRIEEGAARATVKQEVSHLRHGFNLMIEAGEIGKAPRIKVVGGENVREGFIKAPEFAALLENVKNQDTRDVIEFLYHSGWRSSEPCSLEWREVDLHDGIIKLLPAKSKSKKARLLPITGELREIIERRAELRELACPFVFHRAGRRIKSFRRAFEGAAVAVGLGRMIDHPNKRGEKKYVGVLPHDMRRSAVRNFRKAGLSETEGMKLSGHLTNSVYKRYDIIDEDDLRDAMHKVQKHLKREVSGRKVIPLKKKA